MDLLLYLFTVRLLAIYFFGTFRFELVFFLSIMYDYELLILKICNINLSSLEQFIVAVHNKNYRSSLLVTLKILKRCYCTSDF